MMIKKILVACVALTSLPLAAQEYDPPCCYEEMAASYEELASAYEHLAYESRHSCGVFKVGADYLYWHPFIAGLEYAVDGVGTDSQGTIYDVDLGWDSGYRICGGYEFPCQKWILSLSWLSYHTNFKSSTNPAPGLTLYAAVSNPITNGLFDNITAASGELDFRYNSLVGEISYTYRMRCGLALMPILGVCYDYIRDDFNIQYRQAANPTSASVDQEQRFNGIGPEFGIGSEWSFFGPLAFYSKVCWKPLWSRIKTQYRYDVAQAAVTSDVNLAKTVDSVIQAADLAVGIKMNYHITPRMGVLFALGWETHYWFDAGRNIFFLDTDRVGSFSHSETDFIVGGLTARMMVTF